MDNLEGEHEDLANEVLSALTEKFESLPVIDRSILAIATIEAASTIIAEEVGEHAELYGLSRDQALSRIQEYASLLFRNVAITLQQNDALD